MEHVYKVGKTFALESGEELADLQIAYHTYGTLNSRRDNIIWVCHALTANSDVADWWPHTVESGRFLDPSRYFIVCANVLGSHYGTTGPLSVNPKTGRAYYGDFPRFTIRDIVNAHRLLAEHLGISRVRMIIGSSLGGFQAMEWCIIDPDFAETAVLIATTPRTKPWAAAFNESQRMAIECDSTFGDATPEGGMAGMAAARSIALLSYRGGKAYDLTQDEREPQATPFERRVHGYQRHQGDKICRRFNAWSYYRLSQAVDSHDIGRGRGTVAEVLAGFKPRTMVIAIPSDILFPPSDHQDFVDNIPDVSYMTIESEFGHDGFLIEHDKLNQAITNFLTINDHA
jgi:homoserine O-acetyltransferase